MKRSVDAGPVGPVTSVAPPSEADVAGRLRRAVLAVAVLTCGGTALELVLQHHWTERSQLIAWVALAALLADVIALFRPASRATVQGARAGAVLVIVAAAVGFVVHVHGNYEAGPLDEVWGPRWDSLTETSRWWAAATQQVGPAPVLAPGVLVVVALLVLIATIDHPALRTGARGSR